MAISLNQFLAALCFLTVVPIRTASADACALRDVMAWFPLVGAFVGTIGFGSLWLGTTVLPPPVAAGLALAAMVWITGGLHEDGMSDMADGVGAHVSRERSLEIMRDSRIGAFGAIALILSLGLRWSALAALAAATTPWQLAGAVIGAAAAGRTGILITARSLPPARPDGMGAAVSSGADGTALVAGLVLTATVCAAAGIGAIVALMTALLAIGIVIRLAYRRLGGYTGDVFGAVAVVGETATLIGFSAILA